MKRTVRQIGQCQNGDSPNPKLTRSGELPPLIARASTAHMSWLVKLFGARSQAQDPGPAPDNGVTSGLGPTTIRERGDLVGGDAVEAWEGYENKLADNVGVALTFTYAGSRQPRTVLVDAVYGRSLDWPTDIRGRDSKRGEARTFRIDRIDSLHREHRPPVRTAIPWWIGAMVRSHSDLPLSVPPFRAELDVDLLVEEAHSDGRSRQFAGRAGTVDFGYTPDGPWLRLQVTGRSIGPANPQDRTADFRVMPEPRGWKVVALTDAETGEVLTDFVSWVAERVGVGMPE